MQYLLTIPDEDSVPEKDTVYIASALHSALGSDFELQALVADEACEVTIPNVRREAVEFDPVVYDGHPPEASGVDWDAQRKYQERHAEHA